KESAEASLILAQREFDRTKDIFNNTKGRALSKSNMDQAESQLKVAVANLDVAEKALRLMEIGTRYEEIAQQEAQVAQTEAQLNLLKTQLADSQLISPSDAVVRRRLLEPGDMASPQKAVFSLAVQNPIWARAYVSESQLGEFKPGQKVDIFTDSLPGKAIPATVGFVSSVAEFTPKSIETEDLRTSLVYEVRAYIDNPPPELKLGMPVTVVPVE
ncbi:MAG: HlyD family efflux transporter periplasmic adaptor subunit, partial [Burkholderiales bacterium]|nr:HlyD family efflux transporter periplasmic adaptor subunit [Burkholderiales bacterium]